MGSVHYLRPKKSSKYIKVIAVFGFLAAVYLLLSWPTNLIPDEEAELTTKLDLLNETVTALERGIEYFFKVGDSAHLDSVFTVRVVEAQLAAFLRHVIIPYKSSIKNGRLKSLTERVITLQETASSFRRKFANHINHTLLETYAEMHFISHAGDWDLWYPQRDVDLGSVPTYGYEKIESDHFETIDSDHCLMEPYVKHCQFTKACWDLMAHPFYYGYSLTHEIFFILNSLALGCKQEAEISSQKWKNMSTDQLMSKACATVLHESELIADRGYPLKYRDMFMEQPIFCGILGYREFFRDEWLTKIISWQNPSGCYGIDLNVTKLTTYLKAVTPRESLTAPTGHHRQKRDEHILPDGCFLHMTGVAMAALGQYVRFFLEPLILP